MNKIILLGMYILLAVWNEKKSEETTNINSGSTKKSEIQQE